MEGQKEDFFDVMVEEWREGRKERGKEERREGGKEGGIIKKLEKEKEKSFLPS